MTDFARGRRALLLVLASFCLVALALAVLHVLFHDLRVEGVSWFNLDKERNFPTWFSGLLFALFGVAALTAYHWESVRNHESGEALFRLPILWLGVAAVGFAMSVDEMTVLHENLFWREVRESSSELGEEWRYITQWQILYSPAIAVAVAYMVFFFSNRLGLSRAARNTSFAGIGCWLTAVLLEGMRETFKFSETYMPWVVVEELLEMAGAICLTGAISWYVLAIATDLNDDRRRRLAATTRLLQPRALIAVAIAFAVMTGIAFGIHRYASRLAEQGAQVPQLMRKVLAEKDQPPSEEDEQAAPAPR